MKRIKITPGSTNALAVVRADGRPVLAAGGQELRILEPGGTWRSRKVPTRVGTVRSLAAVHAGNDRELLACAGSSGEVEIWDPVRIKCLERRKVSTGTVLSLCEIEHEGRQLLASAGDSRTISVWDHGKKELHRELPGHRGPVTCLRNALIDGRKYLATSGNDQTVRLWDLAEGVEAGNFSGSAQGTVWSLTAIGSTIGFSLASGGYDRVIRLWKHSHQVNETHVLRGHTNTVRFLVTVPLRDELLLVSASDDHSVKFWDLTQRIELRSFDALGAAVMALAVIPSESTTDGTWLAAGIQDGSAILWQL